MGYVMRQGRRIEVEPVPMPGIEKKKRRKSFRAFWVKLPRSWRAPRDWTEMVGEAHIVTKLTPEQVGEIIQMLANRPRPEQTL